MVPVLRILTTRFGRIGVDSGERGITRCVLPHEPLVLREGDTVSAAQDALLTQAEQELNEYVAGERRVFTVPLEWSEGADGFAGQAQRALLDIPYGVTETYGQLAARLGHAGAARAVGTACARNPLPLFVPCHRVVRAGGSIGRYAGGESMKRELLDLEAAVIASNT